ncbi:Protein DGCR14 [Hypsizygus marmoreus]|uniref:Protein DGCR14 n=1 Tax=Hypsizygus marmoreus TaxID=39966 RepID=A0A369KE42_HYPMA|nr:Protein DGCR14 [Hypsizygus marmoreus]
MDATPHVEHSLNRQIVLEEDEYTEALSQIIARDFFPSLVHLDATNDYLDALHSRDPHLINASVRRLEHINSTPVPPPSHRAPHQTPSQTPYAFGPSDTPLRTPRGEAPNKRPRLDTSLTLDSFQAQYTSEDNSSFTHILDSENRKRKEKWAWAWDAQKRVEGQRDRMIEARKTMLIEAPPVTGVRERFVIEAPTVAGLITDGRQKEEAEVGDEDAKGDGNAETSGEGKEVILQGDKDAQGSTQVDVMAPKKDTRSAGVDGWKFKARNSLMFSPDADESPYHPNTITEGAKDPKVIKHGNTRLAEYEHSSSSARGSTAPPSPTRSRIEAAITGTPYRPRSPTINDFSLVPSLPSPTAAELGPTAVKQLMTWGTLNATPRVISQCDDPALPPPSTPFHIPAISSREAISHKLSNNASKSLRTKAGLLGLGGRTPGIGTSRTPAKRGAMGPPQWTPRRSEAAGSLTPAARRLLERTTMGTAAAKRAEAMERSAAWEGNATAKVRDLNRVRWTPTPSPVTRR